MSYGGLLFDPVDNSLEFFRKECGLSLTSLLTHGGEKKQVVGQAELLPSIAARVAWRKKFAGRKVIHFIENEAARNTLIKGSSPNLDNAWLAGEFWRRETEARSFSWFERVPSPSNPADGPSRGVPPPELGLGLRAKEVPLPKDFEERLVAHWRECAGWASHLPAAPRKTWGACAETEADGRRWASGRSDVFFLQTPKASKRED